MIHLESLTKEFGGYRLFDGVSWHIRRADRIALVGDNGAGKSTLMRLLAGIEEPEGVGERVADHPLDNVQRRGREPAAGDDAAEVGAQAGGLVHPRHVADGEVGQHAQAARPA